MKNQYFKVLDKGFVGLVDWMGGDDAIVQAARVSYGAGTKKVSDDRNLIRYLMRHNHTSPFEMCEIKLHVKVPMDCWRQWIRHRTASVNEYSTRYSEAIMDKQETPADKWRLQSSDNKQGSDGYIDLNDETPYNGTWLSHQEEHIHKMSEVVYQHRLKAGVAREQARKDLPLSTYTEAYWKIDLNNLFRFLKLRLDPHAQEEIRLYAHTIACITKELFPISFEAFLDYELNSIKLSSPECRVLGEMSSIIGDIELYGINNNMLSKIYNLSGRELQEFVNKIQNLRTPKYNLNYFNIRKLEKYEKTT